MWCFFNNNCTDKYNITQVRTLLLAILCPLVKDESLRVYLLQLSLTVSLQIGCAILHCVALHENQKGNARQWNRSHKRSAAQCTAAYLRTDP